MKAGDKTATGFTRVRVMPELPWKFEAGTPDISAQIGLGAAADYLMAIGMENVRAHERDLVAYTLETLAREIPGIELYGPPADQRSGVIPFNLPGVHPHDVAQVLGAGYLISDEAGTVATYVKLLRVAMLIPVVFALTWLFRNEGASASRPELPTFLVAFVILAAANSVGLVPPAASDAAALASRWCLVTAIAALGMKTALEEMTKVGWRPIAIVVMETLFLLGFVLAVLLLTGQSA